MSPRTPNPLAGGAPPAWAVSWGDDVHGVWAGFELGGVEHRLRFIREGTFKMGSDEDEPGRLANEGPQHEVKISRGFWLGETPVTQALWEAVMGNNPSRFRSPARPVEMVSFEDVQRFLQAANGKLQLGLRLPTEVEWEYACRAGSKDATYAGRLDIRGDNDAPVLDAIAWYGGNSGLEYELEEAQDSSGWPGKQYAHTRAGSHPVAEKHPNAWGLYDMLGNVEEWCHDGRRAYGSDALTDPVGPTTEGTYRVVRGGSWYGNARYVRAAYRIAIHPSYRDGYVGFRLARGR